MLQSQEQPGRCHDVVARLMGLAPALLAFSIRLFADAPVAPPVGEEITVTATRSETRLDETPVSVVIAQREDLDHAASPAVDDALRTIPGFTLFRRSGSRTANPTTQGVSLRGIGASGASRSIVLDDGVPMNDPFGGWIYWGRIPREDVQRVEVLRGGGSDLYGASALSGVINVLRYPPSESRLSASAAFASEETGDLSASVQHSIRLWELGFATDLFTTDGYIPVKSSERGAVDVAAWSEHAAIELKVLRPLSRGNAFARLSRYEEDRGNGTPFQNNETEQWQLSLGSDLPAGPVHVTLRGYATDQKYEQSFTAISADRESEQISRLQSVPSDSLGFTAVGRGAITSNVLLVGGVESRRVRGTSNETIFGNTVQNVVTGGSQGITGAFAEALINLGPHADATLSARGDWWTNEPLSGSPRSESALSPRISATYRFTPRLAATASAYRSFRPPTLNELYRNFRVGNILTVANEELEAETLTGYEAGVILIPRADVRFRVTAFRMNVDDPVANVTVATTPALITRQRRNLGSTQSEGVEVDGEARSGRFSVTAGYLYVDATVTESDGTLDGLRVPQVPQNQFSLGCAYRAASGPTIALQLRASGDQYEDDRNELVLDNYAVVDLYGSVPLRHDWSIFGAVENAFDEEYAVGRTPVETLGQPRSLRAGLRYRR